MFEDILKNKEYDIEEIRKNIGIYLATLAYEIIDTLTLNKILLDVNNYLNGYYGLNTSEIFYNFDKKSVIIKFNNEKLVFVIKKT